MTEDKIKFGDFCYKRRIELGYTLREFCKTKGYDPAYISRIENNLLPAPDDYKKLSALALALELEEANPDWVKFFDLAAAAKGKIPEDIKDSPELIKLLPAFYRTIRSKKLTKQEIEQLLKILVTGKEEDGSGENNSKVR